MRLALLALLALSACTVREPQFAQPNPDDPVWHLNQGEWPSTNAFIPAPLAGPKDLLNAGR